MLEHLNLPESTQTQRLFHGRGHAYAGFEHICIDWFAPVILITAYKAIEADLLAQLVTFFSQPNDFVKSIQYQQRYLPQAPVSVIWGDEISELQLNENGLKYHATLGRSQNHGLFLDMALGRAWVREQSQNKAVLNLFAYTCGFSIAAHAGGARKIVNLDMSKAALKRGRDNHLLNQQDPSIVQFEAVDLFKSFGRVRKHGPYDLVICDPPAFQKGSVNIERDYKKIIRRLPEFCQDQALVMLCLNSPDLDQQFLSDTVAEYCPQCQFIENIPAPDIFKEAMAGKGLKIQVYRFNAIKTSN
ncbi:class I SAM-dependent methyltransferase [Catenovulum sp. 2E275]|uniref:class I SAM-dependent methyltransferase n=1 Tax=Catenovulum sp. 2E275 TaxID=2980497 RepID=UPI0021D28BE0|nr:class I SAM-dependent methyltransferase [Catenovulum sp. 2E275]MCU4675173.1 class I SAM-dependent methyltransferase [Catenovulum sp. 2E275]